MNVIDVKYWKNMPPLVPMSVQSTTVEYKVKIDRMTKNILDEIQCEVTACSGTNWSNPNHRKMAYFDGVKPWSWWEETICIESADFNKEERGKIKWVKWLQKKNFSNWVLCNAFFKHNNFDLETFSTD